MNLFPSRYVSVYLFLLIQTISGLADVTNMNLTEVHVGHNYSEETDIDLSKNLISQVEDNAFVLFPYLRKLLLDHNQISFLSDSAFNGTSLQHLSVSNNKLTALPNLHSIGMSLQLLSGSNNLIEKIGKDEFMGVTGLQQLNIDSNQLTFVHSEAFSDCTNTRSRLHLEWSSSLTSIPAEMFRGMVQLDLLDIKYGAPTWFPDFRYLPDNNKLTKLWIDAGYIGDLPINALYKLRKLNDFRLYASGPTRVPDFSQQRGVLRYLLLITNIRDIPNTGFDNLPLRYLLLQNNKLTRLPNLQSIQSTLEYLVLSGNNFSTVTFEDIHEMITYCPLLNYVFFQNTNIKTFPDILQLSRPFKEIYISNPGTMRCDCALEWMIGLEDKVDTDIEGNSRPCAAPPRLVGRKWATINRTDLCHGGDTDGCYVCTPCVANETVGKNILAAALGVSLGVVFLIFVVVVVVLVCRMRSSSSSNKSRDNKQEGEDNHDYLEIVDGNSTCLEPASYNTEPTEPSNNPDEAGVYDEIDDLELGLFAMGAQAGVVTVELSQVVPPGPSIKMESKV